MNHIQCTASRSQTEVPVTHDCEMASWQLHLHFVCYSPNWTEWETGSARRFVIHLTRTSVWESVQGAVCSWQRMKREKTNVESCVGKYCWQRGSPWKTSEVAGSPNLSSVCRLPVRLNGKWLKEQQQIWHIFRIKQICASCNADQPLNDFLIHTLWNVIERKGCL